MKLTNAVAVSMPVTSRGASGEDRTTREARMRSFWADPSNAVLYPAGKVLAIVAEPATKNKAARTVADILASGESVEMNAITIDGVTLPLADGFELSIANCFQTWGCPACHSAHGSGIAPSRKVDTILLATCKFFYRPSDKTLFTISSTCWGDYVQALNACSPKRFISPKQDPSRVKANAPKNATAKPTSKPVTAPLAIAAPVTVPSEGTPETVKA